MTLFTSAHTLTGTQITDLNTEARAFAARTHRQSAHSENDAELWYYRDSVWNKFPVQPLLGPDEGLELTQEYKQPYTLGFTLPDPFGDYTTENQNSGWNYNGAGDFDPLLDEARKICCRVGTRCYTNLAAGILPTSDSPPYAGNLAELTDGLFYDIANSIAGYVLFQADNAVTIDLGAVQSLRHVAIRFASLVYAGYPRTLATVSFPRSVQVSLSTDGVNYTPVSPARPVAQGYTFNGITLVPNTPGDWDDSIDGETREFAFCDLQRRARYVKFAFVDKKYPHATGDPGYILTAIDELAVYGGPRFEVLGRNLFTGYLGDQIEFTPDGKIKCLAVDVLKKLADNNDVFLTAAYRLTSAGGVELGDIVHSLLTSSAYWRADTDYNTAFTNAEIGWSSGSGLTGLQYPLWQGQTNSLLGYCLELFGAVGWNFSADGEGILQAAEPPYTQRLPHRVCIAASDGNYDVRECLRHRTGKQMRNRVVVQTGKSKATGSGSITVFNPASVARYGTRTTRITDPLAGTTALRQKVGDYFLRDYAWNLQTLTNVIRPDFETQLKQVFGFRAPARPNLYALTSAIDGLKQEQELWSLVSLQHNITAGQWEAEAEWIPYRAQGPAIPNFTSLQVTVSPTALFANFDSFDPTSNGDLYAIRAYVSTTSSEAGFTNWAQVDSTFGTLTLSGLVAGVPIWVYLVGVSLDGQESVPSQILTGIPGTSAQTLSAYTISDFTVGSTLRQGPDAQGYYTYSFLALWTAPAAGFTQSHIAAYVNPSSPPANPEKISSWPLHDDTWNWWGPDRILAGLTWDNATPGPLDFVITFRSKDNLSGLRIYFRIWNSARSRAWIPVPGNFTFCTVM